MGSEPSVFAPRVLAGDSPAGPTQPSERLTALLEISSDWYWEQDEQLRFTVLRGRAHKPPGMGVESYIGSTRWDHGEVPVADGGQWDAHRAQLAAHQPFSDFVLKRVSRDGELRFISSSGVPVFDAGGRFKGYCGVAKDVTVAMRDQLQRTLQHGVTLALAASDDVREAAARILRVFCETCDWEGGACFSLDAGQQRIGVIEAWAAPGSALAVALDRVKAAPMQPVDAVVQTHPSWVAGRPAWLDQPTPQRCLLAQPEVVAQGIRGAFCVPIKVDDRVSGMLELLSRSPVTPDPGLPEVAELLGSQMGEFARRVAAQRSLRESEERFRALVELSSDWYWEQDENLRFTKFAGTGGAVPFEQARGKTRWELPIVATEELWAAHKAQLAARLPFRDLELQVIAADGSKRYNSVSGRPLFDRHGRFRGYHGLSRDITARKLSEERIEYLANHDALTGLPNRSMFSTVLNMTINSARRYARQFALVFVDLDRFKLINDTLGHQAGDALLQEIAKRLSQGLRGSDLVARLGGDEFVVLVQEIAEEQQAASVARKILSAVMQPMVLLGQECRVTASVGVTMFPRDAQDEHGLMKNADLAMYLAKEEGKNNFQFFSKEIRTHTLERLTLESALRRALEREELTLHYQAKLDLLSGRITGAEALLRWTNAELGVVSPAQFIPVAEETGLIVPIGRWVLRSACTQNVAWQREGLPPLCMAVNLSPRQFFDEFLLRDILAVLDETGMDPGLLELEITESMVMQDSRRTSQLLAHIKEMGVRLAIDDFGTGYSSLAQIKRFPIDTIKVDRSFIRNLPLDAEDKAITQAIIAMGKTLSLTVVAEGVETEAQEAFLREHDCDQTQGYYFSKPAAAAEFAQLLRQHRA